MSKIKTINQLQDFLDQEFSWRLKEISDLKTFVRSSASLQRNTIIRAGVPLLYAHWEGFIKNSSQAYLDFVNNQRHKYEELASCFIVFGVKKKLADISSSKQAHLNTAIVDFFLTELKERAVLQMKNAVNTESNLSSSVFQNIASSIGIDTTSFETKFHLIDETLLKKRNEIAHGEHVDLLPEDYRKLADETITLMRNYKTDIENAAVLKKYLR